MFAALMQWMKANKLLPQVSATERQALEAGQVWLDGDFFGGNPDFRRMLAYRYRHLSKEEKSFLDGPVETLLQMADGYSIAQTRVVPDEILQFMREQGFYGLIIPKRYGGKEFSTLARSNVMAKIAPHSSILSTYVVIPNTLGAAELLIAYGTQEQKDRYLPLLARGYLTPCFALTEPMAGSDAAGLQADAEVFAGEGDEPMLRLNFRKRYITLAPIADLISLACRLRDPHNLLGKGEHPGITIVLLHRGEPGLIQGDRHEPIGEAFPNGPLIGHDVVVRVNRILGGIEHAGQGWRMLMEQLAGGRMVSLPAGAVGGIRAAAALTGAYSMVRQQFGMPIGHMEGIEQKVGRLAALSYLSEAARVFGCSAVDEGIHPPVVSGILKAYTTELARSAAIDAMDVFAGAGVMQGPNNIMGRGYCSAPVGVTVEGANTMTRTLMIFGQGATRSHPYAFKLVAAAEQDDASLFRRMLLGWLWHFASSFFRTLVRGFTRGWTVSVPETVHPQTRRYYRRIGWATARFGYLADLAMFSVGGRLKARGNLTGRFSDVLGWLVLAFSTLRRFEAEGRREEDLPLVHYAIHWSLSEMQKAFEGIYQNLDGFTGTVLRFFALPWLAFNPLSRPPGDAMNRSAAQILQRHDAQAQRLLDGVFLPADDKPGAGRLLKAFRRVCAAEPLIARVRAAQHAGQLPRGAVEDRLDEAVYAGILSPQQRQQIEEAHEACLAAIEVDTFSTAQWSTPATGTATPQEPYQHAVNG
jgi:acyl-CoA dehydrogenase